MFKFKALLILTIFIASIFSQEPAKCEKKKSLVSNSQNDSYRVPSNTEYPYGDEEQVNCNFKDTEINKAGCSEITGIQELKGKCPSAFTKDNTIDPYTPCPDSFTLYEPANELIFTTTSIVVPQVQCKKCDLRLTKEKDAVVVECFHCFDVPSSKQAANRTEKNILYKAFFVQVANYTSVEVTGVENF